MKKNDLIGVGPHPGNTHGCGDFAVLKANGDGTATVIEAQSCHNCWQVGHDNSHTFAIIGEVWDIDEGELKPANEESWSTSVKWEMS